LYLAEWKHKAGKADDSAPRYDDIYSSPSASITEFKKEKHEREAIFLKI
jgi:hypothetical protein